MKKAVVFDVGNVLIGFDVYRACRIIFGHNATANKVYHALWEADGAINRWREFDLGIDDEAVMEGIISLNKDLEKQLRFFFKNIGFCVYNLSTTKSWLSALKDRGLKLYYLSNYSNLLKVKNPLVIDFVSLMDGGLFSCDVKCMKPDINFYKQLIQAYDIDPKVAVYIDDLKENLEPARSLGFDVLQFTNFSQTYESLNLILK